MKQEGIPGFVWYLALKGFYKEFTKQFTIPVETVKSGIEPLIDTSCWGRTML
jgi:hypothetical protein